MNGLVDGGSTQGGPREECANREESNGCDGSEGDPTMEARETAVLVDCVFSDLFDVAAFKVKCAGSWQNAEPPDSFQWPPILEEMISQGFRLSTVLMEYEFETGKRLSVYHNGAESSHRRIRTVGKLTFKPPTACVSDKELHEDTIIVTGIDPYSGVSNRLEHERPEEVCNKLLKGREHQKKRGMEAEQHEDEDVDSGAGQNELNNGENTSDGEEEDSSDGEFDEFSEEDFTDEGDSGAVVYLEHVKKNEDDPEIVTKIPYGVHRGWVASTYCPSKRYFTASPLCAFQWHDVRQRRLAKGLEDIWGIFTRTPARWALAERALLRRKM